MIWPEYVAEILDGVKTVEYRSWATKHRGDFFIGCTATRERNGYICVLACLDDVTFNKEKNIYEWHLSNIRTIKPIPIKGRQRLFETGIDEYQITDDLSDDEFDAIWDEAESWMLKPTAKKTKE